MQTETMGREYATSGSNYSRPQPNEVDTSKTGGPSKGENKEDNYLLQMAQSMTPQEREMFCEICEELNEKAKQGSEAESAETPDSEAGGQVSGDNSDNNQMTS
jgi:hypothetical protein